MLKKIFILTLILISHTHVGHAFWEQKDNSIENCIVKVYNTSAKYDYYNPWSLFSPQQGMGSASVLKDHRILTNAHVVSDAKFIQIRKHGESKKYKAFVDFISHDADLAILRVNDNSFFEGCDGLKLGDLPQTQEKVVVYGFPFGGDALSITQGVLSRIEHQSYAHSDHFLLAGQIDAPINPGNSGGPVVVNGKIVGVVMQANFSENAENLGYMVPSNVVNHFLKDIEDKKYDGFPSLGINTQSLESPVLRNYLKLPENKTGVLIVNIQPSSPAKNILEENDILMKVDGHPVAYNKTVEFRSKERTSYTHFIDAKQIGESINLEVLRNGKTKNVKVKLSTTVDDFNLIPLTQYEKSPRYYIYGGIVFVPLTSNLIKRWGKDWSKNAPQDFLQALSQWPEEKDQEVIIALKVLADDINEGYHDLVNWRINKVNGIEIKNFKQFVKVLEESKNQTIFLDEKGFKVVINHKDHEKSLPQILQNYRIKSGFHL